MDRPVGAWRAMPLRTFRGERGASLPYALIVIMVAMFLLVPTYQFIASRQTQVKAHESAMGARYADDAAIEYAIWRLGEDNALRQELLAVRGTPITLTVPGPVNDVIPVVDVVLVNPEPWPWAMWALYLVEIKGNNSTIHGGVHSNGAVSITGNNTVIDGVVEQNDPEPPPVSWNIVDFRPGGSEAQKAAAVGQYHGALPCPFAPNKKADLMPGLYYSPCDVVIASSNIYFTSVTIAAEGTITFSQTANKDNFVTPYVPGLVLFSSNAADPAIYIDSNKFSSASGVLYAPFGQINLDGNKTSCTGSFVARTITVSKNSLDASVPYDMTVPDVCSLYDVRAIARERTGVARVRFCPEVLPRVEAWSVE